MYNINLKYKLSDFLITIILFFVGILTATILLCIKISTDSRYNATDSKVVAHTVKQECSESTDTDGHKRTTCYPVFLYNVNGVEYSCKSHSTSAISNYKDNIVYYNSKNPSECISAYEKEANKIINYILFVPIIFILASFICIIPVINKKNKKKKLAYNGILYKQIPCTSTYINNINIIKFTLTFPNGDIKEITYKSSEKNKIGINGYVDILIDQDDYSNYYVDNNIEKM